MKPKRPYLIRAMREWLIDNGETPFIKVDTRVDGDNVPKEFVGADGYVTLNLAAAAGNVQIDDEWIVFKTSFRGNPHVLHIYYGAVVAIVSKETRQGLQFEAKRQYPNNVARMNGKPKLTLVVNNDT